MFLNSVVRLVWHFYRLASVGNVRP